MVYPSDVGTTECVEAFDEILLVERHDLRHVDDRFAVETGGGLRKDEIARGVGESEVGGDRDAGHGLDLALVVGIGRHDDDRASVRGRGPSARAEVSPPNVAPLRYQSSAVARV